MKTTTQIKDQIVRKGASELVQTLLEDGQFFKTEEELIGWAEEQFDVNELGRSPSNDEYDEVMDIMMGEVHDRVYEFFQQAHYAMFEKAFLVQKSLDHDTSI